MASPGSVNPLWTYIERLQSVQLPDGSWPYRANGDSGLAEPTCYALLALHAAGIANPKQTASLDWLESLRRDDGGFAPQPGVHLSNWSTSLVTLTQMHCGREDAARPGIQWLLGLEGRETHWLTRAVRKIRNIPPPYPQNHVGWPWLANTVSWLIPTVLAALALERAQALKPDPKVAFRVQEAIAMLKERRCQDGGWNHGASIALDVAATSYPETTGMALLCLHTVPASELPGADDLALSMLADARIANIISWLQLALHTREVSFPDREEKAIQCRNTLDFALRVLALSAAAGNNIFKA